MADDKTYKSPEELEEAVGEKIEELFGALSDREATPAVAGRSAAVKARPVATTNQPKSPSPAPRTQRPSVEELLDRIEALVLNLEWETKLETIRELSARLQDAEPLFPTEGTARNILEMNRRVLRRSSSPGTTPHPALVKLLQESTTALRQIRSSRGAPSVDKRLIASIVDSYNRIMTVDKPAPPKPVGETPKESPEYGALIGHVKGAVHSIEEVSKRLGRIVNALRSGSAVSGEEITRRLGTLEGLLSERVSRLLSLQRELSQIRPPEGPGPASPEEPPLEKRGGPEGVLLIQWAGLPLAIPSFLIVALYPLTKPQAQQFAGKTSIMLGNRAVPRLPLKKPEKPSRANELLPSWLIHLSRGQKEFFLLADRAMGYRRSPQEMDVSRQSRIKIGETGYIVLNLATFR